MLFDKFKNETKKIKVCGGEEVEIRKLTNKEYEEVQSLIMGDATAKEIDAGEIRVSIDKMSRAQLLTVAYGMVTPKQSLKDLEKLPVDSMECIGEIYKAIEEFSKPKK